VLLDALGAPGRHEVPAAIPAAAPFVGRRDETAALERHLQTVIDGTAAVVRIRGESGIGKTALLRKFSETLVREQRAPVLAGRCHPQETVPFRAVDAVVDQLSRYLVEVEGGASELVPRHTGRLLTLFPVLSRVPELARAAENEATKAVASSGPQESERQALWALREILARIADRRGAVILWIDDTQWGDAGSARVLERMLSPPDPPRLLLLLTYRPHAEAENSFLEGLERTMSRLAGAQGLAPDHRRLVFPDPIDLGPLGADDVAQLVESTFPDRIPERLQDVHEIVAETGGSPFLISELQSRLLSGDSIGQPGSLRRRLEEAIHRRLERLGARERALVGLVAISGGPLERTFALDLAGVTSGGEGLVADLCARSILKRVATLDKETLEIYHDRIRETFLAAIQGTPELADGHRRLADALFAQLPEEVARALAKAAPEEGDGEVSAPLASALKLVRTVQFAALVEHLVGAGDTEAAARAADLGSRVAGLELQFEREAELLELALRLGGSHTRGWRLLQRMSGALANAGRWREAAESTKRAAAALDGSPDDGIDLRTSLMSRAGSEYLFGGYLDEGRQALLEVLRKLDVPVPASSEAARRASLRLRLRFILRGLFGLRVREGDPLSTRDELRLNATHGAWVGLSLLDFPLADAIGIWRLLEIVRLRAKSRVPAAYSTEGAVEALVGGRLLWWNARRILGEAERVAKQGKPYDRVTVLCCQGQYHYWRGEWEEAQRLQEDALELALAETSEQKHGIAHINAYRLSAVAYQGDLRYLAKLRDEVLSDARRRGDVLTENLLESAEFVLVRLARDQADAAVRAADAVLESFHADHFTSQNYYHLIATVKAHVYAERGVQAWRQVDQKRWALVEASGLHKQKWIGTHMRYLRACAAIAAASELAQGRAKASETEIDAAGLLSVARREARWIRRTGLPFAKAMARAIEAGIAVQTGRSADSLLLSARDGFAESSMRLHASSAAIVLAQLRGESAPEAETWMREQDVLQPLKMARTHVPVHVG
jgi:hypothetical protein